MDFLNKAFAQLADLFRSMTPGARITAGLLLLVVVVSLGYLFTAGVSSPDCDLMNGEPVPGSRLAAMEAAFAKAGLNSYEIRGTQILIPRGQRNRYMAALADADALPPNIHTVLSKAIQESSPFLSKQQQADRVKVGLQQALALIISEMQGIHSAYVLYASEEKRGFRKETVTTASASVKPEGNEHLNESQVALIRQLLVHSIPGLKPEGVTVADLNGQTVYGGDPASGGSARENLYVSLKRIHEQEWKAKILNALTYIPGVKVTPNVELDRDQINRTKSIKYEPKGFALHEEDESSEITRETGKPAGQPGYKAQQPNTPTALAASRSKGSHEEESESKRSVHSIPNTEETESQKIGLTPERVSVSIAIPRSHYERLWREDNPAEDGQEPPTPDKNALDTIRQEVETAVQETVATLLPVPKDGTDPTSLVTVKMFRDIKAPEIPAPGLGENAMAWFGRYWGTLGILGLAAFSLVMLRSMVRAAPGGPEPAGRSETAAKQTAETPEESAEEAALKRLARFSGSGPSLIDELSDLVQEDPAAAANILRNWIGTGV